jgi:hypothetical protein
MAELYHFMGEHPVVTVLIAWSVCSLASTIVRQPFRIINRVVRSRNIAKHGWPKPPMDADGDIVLPKDVQA